MICKNCNHVNSEGLEFCEFCGEKIQGETINLEKTNSYDTNYQTNTETNYQTNTGNYSANDGQSNNNFSGETKFCKSCGAQIAKNAVVCVKCGVATNDIQVEDDGNIIAAVAACCFPIVGIILYFVWKDTKPKSAKNVCIGALIPTILGAIFYFFAFIIGIASGF